MEQPEGVEPAEPGGSRWRLRNWPLRSKLAAVLVVPMLTALVFGGLRAADEFTRYEEFHQTVDQLDVARHVTAVVDALQAERSLAVAKGPTGAPDRAALDAQTAKVDAAVRDLREAANHLHTDEATRERYRQGLQRLDALTPLRVAVNTTSYPDLAVFVTYRNILDSLIQLGREVNTAITDRELLRQGTTVQALSEAKEFVARENAALQIAAVRDQFPADLLDRTIAAQASARAAIANFVANATPEQQQLYSDTVSGEEVDARERIKAAAFVRARETPPGQGRNNGTNAATNAQANDTGLEINQRQLSDVGLAVTDRMRQVESELLGDLRAQAQGLADNAYQAAWIFTAIMAAALVAALVLMLVIARALLNPLRVLRSSALEVAYVRLPETVRRILDAPDPIEASRGAVAPVPVRTREEIGEVARSFDVVHERAIRMAAEQALLRENVNGIFVNLSRRSQRLVERQLGVIDRLEAHEQDPDQLASLFELDHLATRLRRNGESLLVLSGAGLAKSVPRPVPAADVIGAAVSEIEQYARVEVGVVPEVSVQGLAIHDLVHLLAELLDNATYFSEPETKVSVRAVVTRKKELAIQITDRGVGMNEDQIAEANDRLANPPDLDVSVTRRMGLYVVARLAKRHGIEVRLRENEDIEGGVIARIVVPAELLTPLPTRTERTDPSRRFPAETAAETSSPSLPPVAAPALPSTSSASVPDSPPAPTAAEPRSPEPAPAGGGSNGLVPLDQPIRLDDLVGGSASAAGPFLSSAPAPEPERQWPSEEPAEPAGIGVPAVPAVDRQDRSHQEPAPPSDAEQTFALSLPKEEPRYVPVADRGEPRRDDQDDEASALDDEVPTRRLPIYQSVLSRWFSEAEAEDVVDSDDSADAVDAEEPAPAASPDVATSSAGLASAAGPASAAGWGGAEDSGWQAAQALLESRAEEITPAGLPKRVPNAYLVPGSVRSSSVDAFTDTTTGQPGQGAIARSAAAARNRMASFQQGYQSGRHALRESTMSARSDAVSGNGVEGRSADNRVEE
nr:nitrate- and nitrite sensing domain-containing protein [Amycolatopsis arida]